MANPVPFGEYVLREVLGKGGMGTVYRAEHPRTGRSVALKLLNAEGDAPALDRFRREATTLSRMTHPGIVSVHEVGEVDGTPYIAMELVEGRDLDGVRLGVRRSAEVIRDAARAVQYAHEQGVLHRDLKPGNLMEGPEGRVTVMDFGLAKKDAAGGTRTGSRDLLGTPGYLSPEQARADRKVDPRTDVYGLGATLYALLTGRAPHCGGEAAEVILRVLEEEPTGLRELRREVPGDLEWIVAKAMEKEASRRYATAGSFADDLDRFLSGEPVLARPPSVLYRLRKRLQKRKGLVAVVTGGTALVALTVAWLWPKVRSAEEELKWKEDLRPLEEAVKEAEPYFYIQGDDLTGKLKRVEGALAELERLARDPKRNRRPEIWKALGMGWHFLGDAERSGEALQKAVELAPDDSEIHYHLGRLYLERSQDDLLTKEDVPRGEGIERIAEWGVLALGHLGRVPAGWKTPGGLEEELVEVYKALAAGEKRKVYELCVNAVERHGRKPGTEEFCWLAGIVSLDEQRMEAYSGAIDRKPHFAWALFLRAEERMKRGENAAALEDYSAAIRDLPKMAVAYLNRAECRLETGDAAGALEDYSKAIELRPGWSKAYMNRATVHTRRGEREKAMKDYDEAIRANPRYAMAWTHRGVLKKEMGDLKGALEDQDEAVRLAPRLAQAWLNRAGVWRAKKDREREIEDLGRAIEIDPSYERAHLNRALAYKVVGRKADTERDLQSLLQLNPRHLEGLLEQGNLCGERGDASGQIESYRKALEAAPPGWEYRGRVEETLKKLETLLPGTHE